MTKIIAPAQRTENLRYAVRDIISIADKTKATGMEMLYLNIGDPNKFDFRTQSHLIEPISQAMRDNLTGYSPSSGIPEAVAAITQEATNNGIENILDVFVTTGASEAIEVCLTALVNSDENVLIPSPGYPLYDALLNKLGSTPNYYYLDEDNDWQPDLEDIASKINDKTRAIVLINPNNPTGSICDKKIMLDLIALAKKHDLLLFADEIYDKLILDDEKTQYSLASLDKTAPIITFNGLAKSFVAPGLRIGWGIASGLPEQMSKYLEAINKILRARLCAHHPSQYAIAPALTGNMDYLEECKAKLRARRDLTVDMLNSSPAITCVKPHGAFYAFPSLNISISDEEFVKGLIAETGVVVVHGSGFGQKPGTKHFRAVYLPPEDVLEKAYTKIISYVERFAV